ncbi:hypothetical protein AB3Y40_03640 [Yoonia sp. R2331]|uniref:hypothetical protein n=1 Tax=Yoonia sp. R2331 TaxID=3237238 RepID=UPI0034E4C557
MLNVEKLSTEQTLELMANRVASNKISRDSLGTISKAIFNDEFPVIGFDVCKYGTCWDFEFKGPLVKFDLQRLMELVPGRVRNVDIMIDGITDPERLRVRVGQELG